MVFEQLGKDRYLKQIEMKEFMFYIRNEKDAKKAMTTEENLAFLKKCETYINRLKNDHKLVAAQPLIREGVVVSKAKKGWNEKDIAKNSNIQVGYYHILANGIEEAISIAKENPEFEFFPSASIEVRQVKTEENETGFKILYIIRQIRNYYKYSFLKGNCPALFSSSHPA